jgi:3-deoxy-D-manno-octulosonate 8-phosphate phosphatase (KDO 8-P phosphatase)
MKFEFNQIKLLILDFDGVLTDNFVFVNEEGIESVKCNRSDGIGISRIKKLGIKVVIVSTEKNKVVSVRAKKLNLESIQGVDDKNKAVLKLSKELDIPLAKIAFLGNDINDIPAFEIVGFPIAVADCYLEVEPYVNYITECKGGQGAVREVCDLIYFAMTNS